MASVMAIVSKAVFDKQARAAGKPVGLGDVWPVDAYNSAHKALAPLGEGGALFLVTVRPGDVLWLVGVLESPRFDGARWTAAPNVVAARDVSGAREGLRFSTGKGITAKAGALGMSLQTPRVLTEADVALLRGGASASAPAEKTSAAPAPAKKKAPAEAKAAAPAKKKAPAKPKAATPAKPKAAAVAKKQQGAAPPKGASRPLAAALDALRADNLVQALDQLLDAWAAQRAAATAELVERLGALVDRSLAPIEGKAKSAALDEAWLDVAAKRRAADVPRLAACFENGSTPMLKRWFAQLLDFKPDPRLPTAAVDSAVRYHSTGDATPRTAAFKLATYVADGRQLATLDSVVQRNDTLEGNVARLRKKLVEPPVLSAEDGEVIALCSAELDRLAKQPPPDAEAMFAAARDETDSTEESLVAAVLADPDDDVPRMVYADWLAQRGDPRAELLALQLKDKLTGNEQKRVRELCKAHGARWIFPLDAVVEKPRFERGFLAGCGAVSFTTDKQRDELCEHPLWATVREIDACNESRLLRGDALRALRVVRCDAETLAAIAQKPDPVPLEEVSAAYFDAERFLHLATSPEHRRRWYFSPDQRDPEQLAARGDNLSHWHKVGTVGALVNLKRLRLAPGHAILESDHGALSRFEWLTASPLAKQLEELTIDHGDNGVFLDGWLARLDTLARLRRLEIISSPKDHYNSPNWGGPTHPCYLRFVITREGETRRIELTLDWPYYRDKLRPIDANFAIFMRGFPRDDLPELTMRYSKRKSGVDVAKLVEVAQLLAPHFQRVIAPDGTVVKAPGAAR